MDNRCLIIIAVASMLFPSALHPQIVLAPYNQYEVAYRDGTTDIEVVKFGGEPYLVPEYSPSQDDVVLDVGAHIGVVSLFFSGFVKTVYAIEPERKSFRLLLGNIKHNRAYNIIPKQIALSGNDGEATLHHDPGGPWGDTITHDFQHGGETVHTQTLKTFLDENGIGAVSFAKFNCEGAEFPILLGSDDATLRRIRLMVVLYHEDMYNGKGADIADRLAGAGFTVRYERVTANRGWIIAMRKEDSDEQM